MLLPILWDLKSASLYRIPELLCRYQTRHTLCRLDGTERIMVADELWPVGPEVQRLSRLWSVVPTIRERARFRWNDTTAAHLLTADDAFVRVSIHGRADRCDAGGSHELYRIQLEDGDFLVCCSGHPLLAYTWNGRIFLMNEEGYQAIGDSAPSPTHRCAVQIQTKRLENGPLYAAVRFQDDSFEYLRILRAKDISGCRLLEKRSIDPLPERPALRDFGIANHGHVYFLLENGRLVVRQVATGKTTEFRVSPAVARIVAIRNTIYGLFAERWRLIATF
ncbi:hypothetical protein EBZ80_06565 [bacterium]|nr:hypothetical protein [bacterium]